VVEGLRRTDHFKAIAVAESNVEAIKTQSKTSWVWAPNFFPRMREVDTKVN
jgi:hypothetical protein